ncbi:hypothetical protein OsI_24470 [Oryza sativa Indica Group]|uniref:J domain-containing protein n=1 Tax=Oryza sativa subsp. indica TaxID=39946 RepID=A2YH05_ORYSI|nr:hypothetical protein OsI_24470 [Oryza sativa Indica Group]
MASFASTAAPWGCVAGARRGGGGGGRCGVRASAALAVAAPAARTHYEVLGVGAGASRGEIKAAYRRLAREVHPDAGAAGDEDFIRLHAAYATLADPDERARLSQKERRSADVFLWDPQVFGIIKHTPIPPAAAAAAAEQSVAAPASTAVIAGVSRG